MAELGLEAMGIMGYAAMNAGWNELWLGTDFLKEASSKAGVPLITSNLVYKDSGLPFGKKYAIRKVGDVTVGILGIMPPEPTSDRSGPPMTSDTCQKQRRLRKNDDVNDKTRITELLEILPPEEAVKSLVPEVRKQADIVILLSQCGFEATRLMMNNTEGIDLGITGQTRKRISPEKRKGVPVLDAVYHGRYLGSVRLTLGDNGKLIKNEAKILKLGDMVPFDTRILKITGDDVKKKVREEERQKMEEEARALLKLTPYEYYQLLMKEQQARGRK
ncbi:phosphatase domain-containing protein [Desulfonema magnum]|uniref:Phosphatase domain-containing protein n=2 Tax=Desulfonema magnum TaxID=45655 RepID=A0A975GK90_9BACT|nr:phosphatase domain-containing protein [Desulfonema magnum]